MNSLILFSIILIILLLIFSVMKRLSKGVKRTKHELKRCLRDLLERGFNGGQLLIETEKTDRFLQFQKYTTKENGEGVELAFPKVQWSERFYSQIFESCLQKGYEYRVEHGSDGTQFLIVDFKDSAENAYVFTVHILDNVFKERDKSRYFVMLRNAKV